MLTPGLGRRARLQLVDVALTLQIDAAAAQVGDVHGEAERDLPLDADAPHVGRRVLEDRILAVDAERQVAAPACRRDRVVHAAVGDGGLRLERRVAAEQRRVVQRHAVVEDAAAGANDRLLVELIRHAEARLEHVVVRLREAARLAAEERLDARVGQALAAVALESVARQDDAVVAARLTDQPAGRRVDDRRLGRIVEARIEVRDVVRRRVPRRPQHPPDPAFDGQLAGRPPRVLDEHVGGKRPPLA